MATKSEVEGLRLRKSDDLVKLAADLGYDTYPNQLQCNNGAHVSGLLNFFDDNPGAMEALRDWVLENSDLDEDEEEEDEEECEEEEVGVNLPPWGDTAEFRKAVD